MNLNNFLVCQDFKFFEIADDRITQRIFMFLMDFFGAVRNLS
jgi:hypothetical protein